MLPEYCPSTSFYKFHVAVTSREQNIKSIEMHSMGESAVAWLDMWPFASCIPGPHFNLCSQQGTLERLRFRPSTRAVGNVTFLCLVNF